MRRLLVLGLVVACLGSAGAEQVYTNADVPTYRPRKKQRPKEESGRKGAQPPRKAEAEESAGPPRLARRPMGADSDPSLSVYRPQALLLKAANLPGAKTVYTFEESAFQTLPRRTLRVSNFDREKEQWSVYHVPVSDIIAQEARQNAIDPLIIEIIIGHESGFNVKALSGAGAGGLMQLMPDTAAQLGVTDVNDPEQNIAAGTRYFVEQYRRFGNLHLALAAYNAGPNAVISFKGVPPYEETISYASAIAQEYESRRRKRDKA